MDSENGQLLERLKGYAPRGYLDLAKVLSGTFIRNLLRGAFKLLVAGFLAPQALGILRSILSFFRIICSFADLGLNYTLITFLSAASGRRDEAEEAQVLKTVLALKITVSSILLAVGYLLAPRITVIVFSDPQLTVFVRLVFLAVGGQLLWGYLSGYLSARQQFDKLGYFLVTMPSLMLVCGGILILVERFDLTSSLLIYLFAPALAVVLWWPVLGWKFLTGRAKVRSPMLRKILRFSGWIYVESAASATRNNINPLFLKNAQLSGSVAAGELNAGLYSFGADLASEVAIFSKSLLTVLLPKASALSDPQDLRRFIRKAHRHLLLLIVPLALLGFAAKPFILVLGTLKASYLEYLPSLNVFAILYAGALFSVAAVPIRTALYALKRPQVIVYVELVTTVLMIAGSIALIPKYGGEGAAAMVFVQRALGFSVLIVYGLAILRRAAKEQD